MPKLKALRPVFVTLLILAPATSSAAIQQIPFQLVYNTGSTYPHGTLFDGLVEYDDSGISGSDFVLGSSNSLGIRVAVPGYFDGFIDSPNSATIENLSVVALDGTTDIANTFFLDLYRTSFSMEIQNGAAGGGNLYTAPEVPLPAAAWLFGSGLLTLAGIRFRRSA